MARYWVFITNDVSGPYEVEQLIRLRGFSRQTMVCVDDASGKPTNWISPAEIPELSHIFKAVDEQQAISPPAAAPKVQPKKAAPRAIPRTAGPAVVLKVPKSAKAAWLFWLLGALSVAAIVYAWLHYAQGKDQAQDQRTAKSLVENAKLPPSSAYATLNQYIQDKALKPRWEFDRVQEGLFHVTLSWYSQTGSAVYAFEANSQAQTVRGINTAAIKLLSDGFLPPPSAQPKAVPVKKKSPGDLFAATLDAYRQAVEGGDFQTVWNAYSRRKKAQMAGAGMSREGYIRLQNLTYKVDSAAKETLLKTKDESDSQKLVLLKQAQSGRPDIFLKQVWIFEEETWKLDDEEKRSAAAPAEPPAPAPAPVTPASSGKPMPASLPGMSN